jgi:hypothetical protein
VDGAVTPNAVSARSSIDGSAVLVTGESGEAVVEFSEDSFLAP